MLIKYHGHSEFLLETEDGLRLLMDPFDPNVPFPYFETRADIVTSSHDHADHSHTQKVKGQPVIMKSPGSFTPMKNIKITGLMSFHDEVQGEKRGKNIIYLVQAEKLRLAHLGDLGARPDEETILALKGLDILLIPVGGTYILDALQAAALAMELDPRTTIPMHYKKDSQGFQNIGSAQTFLDAMKTLATSQQPLLRITREDICESPRVVLLDISQ